MQLLSFGITEKFLSGQKPSALLRKRLVVLLTKLMKLSDSCIYYIMYLKYTWLKEKDLENTEERSQRLSCMKKVYVYQYCFLLLPNPYIKSVYFLFLITFSMGCIWYEKFYRYGHFFYQNAVLFSGSHKRKILFVNQNERKST